MKKFQSTLYRQFIFPRWDMNKSMFTREHRLISHRSSLPCRNDTSFRPTELENRLRKIDSNQRWKMLGREGEGREKEGGKIVMVNILLHRNDGSADDLESSRKRRELTDRGSRLSRDGEKDVQNRNDGRDKRSDLQLSRGDNGRR